MKLGTLIERLALLQMEFGPDADVFVAGPEWELPFCVHWYQNTMTDPPTAYVTLDASEDPNAE